MKVLGSGDRRVVLQRETHVSGRKVGRRVLATDVGSDQSGVAQGVNLIPISGVGEAVGGVNEAASDEKTGGNGVEGMFSKDMTPLWPLSSQVTSFTHDCSCKCSHLLTSLYFKSLLPHFLLLPSPAVHPHSSRPRRGWTTPPQPPNHPPPEKRQ